MLKTAFLLGGKFVIIVCTFRALTALRGKKRKKKTKLEKIQLEACQSPENEESSAIDNIKK